MNEALQKADLLYEQEKWDLALEIYQEHLAREPEDAHAYAMAARCYLNMKIFGKASEYAEAAVSVEPNFDYGHYILAVVSYMRNLDNDARRAIETALELSPTNPDYHVLVARLHAKKAQWAAVSDAADVALGFEPTHADALVVKAAALVKLRKYDEARTALHFVLENDPEDEEALVELGTLHLYLNDWDEAFATFERALAVNPESQLAREGFMEALRARYPVYGLILRYFMWMSRFSRRNQQAIQYGLSLFMRFIGAIRRQYPALAPILGLILVIWRIFAYLSWTLRAGTTILLRFNKFGRRLVNKEEVLESNIVGGLWLAALGCWLYNYFVDPFTIFCRLGVVIFTSVPMLVAGGFAAPEHGWPRYAARGIVGFMSFAGIAGLLLLTFGFREGITLLNIYGYGFGFALLALAALDATEVERK